MRPRNKVLCFVSTLSIVYFLVLLGSCSLFIKPILTVEVSLCDSSTISGIFNFGATIKNVGDEYAYEISYDLKLYGSDPGYYKTGYTIDPRSYEPDKNLAPGGHTIMGLVGITEKWIIKSYILTITYKDKSGENMESAEVSGYFDMKDY